MAALPRDILDLIGNTSLVALRHIAPANGARILLKLESENPTGNMKDRMARKMGGSSPAARWSSTPAAAPASRWRSSAR